MIRFQFFVLLSENLILSRCLFELALQGLDQSRQGLHFGYKLHSFKLPAQARVLLLKSQFFTLGLQALVICLELGDAHAGRSSIGAHDGICGKDYCVQQQLLMIIDTDRLCDVETMFYFFVYFVLAKGRSRLWMIVQLYYLLRHHSIPEI